MVRYYQPIHPSNTPKVITTLSDIETDIETLTILGLTYTHTTTTYIAIHTRLSTAYGNVQ